MGPVWLQNLPPKSVRSTFERVKGRWEEKSKKKHDDSSFFASASKSSTTDSSTCWANKNKQLDEVQSETKDLPP